VEAPVNRRALEMASRIAVESLPALVDSLGGNAPASEQTQAQRALTQVLERESGAPSSAPEPVPDPLAEPERVSEPATAEVARVLAQVSGNGADEQQDLDDDPVS
jgi:hypothetical protein